MLPMDPRQVRQTAMICHLAAFAGFLLPLGSLVGPLAMWLLKRDEDPFIDAHGREAVNFHLSLYLYGIVGAGIVLAVWLASFGGLAAAHRFGSRSPDFGAMAGLFGSIGILGLGAVTLVLLGTLLPIVAALKADKGEAYRYPLTVRFLR